MNEYMYCYTYGLLYWIKKHNQHQSPHNKKTQKAYSSQFRRTLSLLNAQFLKNLNNVQCSDGKNQHR